MLRPISPAALVIGILFLIVPQGCRLFSLEQMVHSDAKAAKSRDYNERGFTSRVLQRELFAFADRYQELVAQAADDAINNSSDARVRTLFRGMKVTYVSAIVSMASAQQPLDGLRDLMVAVRLQRTIWADGGDPALVNPTDARRTAQVLGRLEKDLYKLAERAVPAEAINALQSLVDRWRRENPEQRYVAFVRFPNLGASPVAEEIESTFSSGGLLAPIDDVAREVHETRLLAERAMFITQRMPLLLEWHGELLYQGFFASNEVREVLDDLQSYRKSVEGLLREIANVPARVADERRALLGEFGKIVANEQNRFLDRAESVMRNEREALQRTLADGATTYGPILAQLNGTAMALKEVTAALERLQGETNGQSAGADTVQILAGLERLALAATELRLVVEGMHQLFGSKAELRGLETIDAMLSRHERRWFIYSLIFLFALGIVLTASIVLARRMTQRKSQ